MYSLYTATAVYKQENNVYTDVHDEEHSDDDDAVQDLSLASVSQNYTMIVFIIINYVYNIHTLLTIILHSYIGVIYC